MCNPELGIVFLCGVPRSGTTMAQRLISEYFNIRTGQESSVIDGLLIPIKKRVDSDRLESRDGLGLSGYLDDCQIKDLMTKLTLETFSELFKSLTDHYGNGKYDYFLEKTPSNVLFVDEIFQFIPNAKVIVVERDVADTVRSLVRARSSWGSGWVPKGIRGMVNFVYLHQHAVEKCKKTPSENILIENYKDMCEHPKEFLKQLSVFLSADLQKPISDDFGQELQTTKTVIPIKQKGQWKLLEENKLFIKNRAKISFFGRLEIQLILLLLKIKGLTA